MAAYLTHEQLDALVAFAMDEKAAVDTEAINALNQLCYRVQSNMTKNFTGVMKRNKMLNERLEKYRTRESNRIEAGQFEETDLDSAVLAKAILFQLQQVRTYKLSKYKVNAILYAMYASWLYSKQARLVEEHPVATPYGPRFWHAIKKLDTGTKVSHDEWRAFAEQSPAIAAFCKTACGKYYDADEAAMTRKFVASKAFEKVSADKNGGKWNLEINDAEIYAWKKRQKALEKEGKI